MNKKRLRPAVKALLFVIIITIACIGIWRITSANKENANKKDEESQVEILQDNGDLEIIIPEDQESGGF